MQSLKERLYNAINESADKKYKCVFGMDVVWGSQVKDQLNKLGMDHDHEYDKFFLCDDGNVTYTNSKHLVEVTVKLHPTKLNRIIKPDEAASIIKFSDTTEPTFDLNDHPYNLFRAVLNALTVGTYHITTTEVVIDSIDYTVGDFTKDKR